MTELPRCPKSDLPRVLCACCDSFTLTDAEQAYLAGRIAYQLEVYDFGPTYVMGVDSYSGGGWSQPREVKVLDPDKPCGVKDCTRGAGDSFVCPACLDALEVALGDVPGLLEDLLVLTTKQHKFRASSAPTRAPRTGTRWDEVVSPAESALLVNEGFTRAPYVAQAGDANRSLSAALLWALRAIGDLDPIVDPATASRRLLSRLHAASQSPDAPAIVEKVTAAHGRAMRVIDRPDDSVYIGLCGECGKPMHANPDDDSHTCVQCGETFNVTEQRWATYEPLFDQPMPLREMSTVAPRFGLDVTHFDLKNWAKRGKLNPVHGPREDGDKRPSLYLMRDAEKVLGNMREPLAIVSA